MRPAAQSCSVRVIFRRDGQHRPVDVGDNPFSAQRGYSGDHGVAKIIVQTL
jgi:hypothetical protein